MNVSRIHGLGSSAVDYVISDIPLRNKIINFDILNYHENELNHSPLIVNINFVMHNSPIETNSQSEKYLILNKNKVDIFQNDLNNNIFPLSSRGNI